MPTDDLTALAAISLGAVASAAMTFALTAREAEPFPSAAPAVEVLGSPATCPTPGQIVDFAIIRSDRDRREIHLMVGPEGEHSGWDAEARTLRLGVRRR